MPTGSRPLRRWLAAAVISFSAAQVPAAETFHIAFGSCLRQWKPQPVWNAVLAAKPDLFVMLGDNVYTDTGPYRYQPEPQRIAKAYIELENSPGFTRLRAEVPILATWDDHDYGVNDGGAEYPHRDAARQAFLDFFDIPTGSPLHDRDGIYGAEVIDLPNRRVQVILLDTRSFRSPLRFGLPSLACKRRQILPSREPGATILGDAQWAWLDQRLSEPADLRIIASSIQVIPDAHCFEKWANFPAERERLLAMIAEASGQIIVLSGDRHHGDVSRLEREAGAALHEVTASGLNSARRGTTEPNSYRMIDDNVRVDHFGLLRVEEAADGLRVTVELRDVHGEVIHAADITE